MPRSAFRRALADRQAGPTRRKHWLYVPYDQLTDAVGPLSRLDPHDTGIVLVESPWKAARRPYHRQKLAWVLANGRQFALEQAGRGVRVVHVVADGPFSQGLAAAIADVGPLTTMEAAERELRVDLQPLVDDGRVRVVPHEGWLTSAGQFRTSQRGPPWRMDLFYKRVRRDTGILMEDDTPVGGKFSFDSENRQPWPGTPAAPVPPTFTPDAVTEEVLALIDERFGHHPGHLDPDTLPATHDDAERLWDWALAHCLPHFGPFEDAMSTRSTGLFHTRVSPLLNLHRLTPARVVHDVAAADLPLASQEGFIRQVLGWREFVRHVHRETDGFRTLSKDGAPNFLDAHQPLPPAFWEGSDSGLNCLDSVVSDVWREGWSHHITRLMVLSNLATLLDIDPRALTDWFWVAYVDAFDWVVEPNVLGMGTFATGPLMTTKPYVAGAAYVDRLSDYCDGCAFDPKTTCPVTSLYWNFLDRHESTLRNNQRLAMPLASLRKRSVEKRAADAKLFAHVSATLAQGHTLKPK